MKLKCELLTMQTTDQLDGFHQSVSQNFFEKKG